MTKARATQASCTCVRHGTSCFSFHHHCYQGRAATWAAWCTPGLCSSAAALTGVCVHTGGVSAAVWCQYDYPQIIFRSILLGAVQVMWEKIGETPKSRHEALPEPCVTSMWAALLMLACKYGRKVKSKRFRNTHALRVCTLCTHNVCGWTEKCLKVKRI